MARHPGRRDEFPGPSWFTYKAGPIIARPWNVPGWRPPEGVGVDLDLSVVKLMPEYSCELPLWYVDWWHLKLPETLLDRLADWQATLDRQFQAGEGWTDETARAAWATRADELVAELRRHLPAGTDLDVDLWPLEDD